MALAKVSLPPQKEKEKKQLSPQMFFKKYYKMENMSHKNNDAIVTQTRSSKKKSLPPTQYTFFAQTPDSPCLFIGIDEAGRGCLAGPVVAAAVLLPPHLDAILAKGALQGLTDSKKLTAAARERLAADIRRHALALGIGLVWQAEIDRINILQATFHAMAKAAVCLLKSHAQGTKEAPPATLPVKLCIDGNKTIPSNVLAQYWHMQVLPLQESLVGGDGLIPAISAASIMAKTHRDTLMCVFHRRWPKYNFAKHKGYGTQEHLAAIAQYGPCPLHRLTFGGVRPRATEKNTKMLQGRILP